MANLSLQSTDFGDDASLKVSQEERIHQMELKDNPASAEVDKIKFSINIEEELDLNIPDDNSKYEAELPILEANDIDKVLPWTTKDPDGDCIPDFQRFLESVLDSSSDFELPNLLQGMEVTFKMLPPTSTTGIQSEKSCSDEVLSLENGDTSPATNANGNEVVSIFALTSSNGAEFVEQEQNVDGEQIEEVPKDKKSRNKINTEFTLLKEDLHLPDKTSKEKTLSRARHMIANNAIEAAEQPFVVSARKDKRCRDKISAEFAQIKILLQLPAKTTKATVLRCIRCQIGSLSSVPPGKE